MNEINELQISASAGLVNAANAFLASPTDALGALVLSKLAEDISAAGFELPEDAFIEWGCIEHGVVDVFVYEAQSVIRIEPSTSAVIAL